LKVNFWKSIKSSIYRRSPPPPATFKIAEKLQVNIDKAMGMSKNAALKQVDKMVQELRVVQRENITTPTRMARMKCSECCQGSKH
jgi:hypothetical protein